MTPSLSAQGSEFSRWGGYDIDNVVIVTIYSFGPSSTRNRKIMGISDNT